MMGPSRKTLPGLFVQLIVVQDFFLGSELEKYPSGFRASLDEYHYLNVCNGCFNWMMNQTFTWNMVVLPNIHFKLVVWVSRWRSPSQRSASISFFSIKHRVPGTHVLNVMHGTYGTKNISRLTDPENEGMPPPKEGPLQEKISSSNR